jgi:hypothetical protein
MLFSRISNKVRKRQSAWLYSVVFHGAFSTLLIFVLLMSFLIQPFHKAMAAEALPEVLPEPDPVAADVREQAPVSDDFQGSANDVALEESQATEELASPTEAPIPEVPPDTVIDVPVVPEVPVEPSPIPNPEETEPEVQSESPDASVDDEAVDQDEVAPPDQQSPNGSTTQIVQVESLISEENYYQFSKQSCIAVGDGAYHCTNKEASDIDNQSVVYSGAGADGSMEIFLKTTKGKVRQITENVYDDTSPHYDPESMRVVYQRLVDGRYQIVLYDIMDEKETQLTFSKTNNMEPKISDAGIVWQAWDGNDWEIMLFDGSYTEQLTDNDVQDVAPVIQDGYVLWNVLGGSEQQARVYSLDTKETTSIQGYEGGSIINPRFVLVYDTEYENGDVVTQSFDPSTGLSEPIAAKPAPNPVNIPENDPTGEIRALITSGKAQKDEKDLSDVDAGDGSDGGPVASSTPGTLDLKAPGGSVDMTTVITPANVTEEPFELTEYDLVIPQNALEETLQSTQE